MPSAPGGGTGSQGKMERAVVGEGCVARCHYITMTVHVKLKECHIFDYLFFVMMMIMIVIEMVMMTVMVVMMAMVMMRIKATLVISCGVIEFYCSSPDGSSVGFLFSGPSKYPIVHNVERTFQVKLG